MIRRHQEIERNRHLIDVNMVRVLRREVGRMGIVNSDLMESISIIIITVIKLTITIIATTCT